MSIVKSLNICVLAALHELTLSSQFCDELYVLKNGNIVCTGAPIKIITKEIIKEVYDVDSNVHVNPITNKLLIEYLPPEL